MNTEYKRELEKNYLIIKPDTPEDSFSVQMLLENQIEGLLRFERRVFNGEVEYYYDITGKHSLENEVKKKRLGEQVVRSMLQRLYCVEGNLYSYFLGDGGLFMESSYIFLDEKGFYFVYNPSVQKRKEGENLVAFVQELQEIIDYEEEGAMQLTYCFYQMLKESEKGILQILEEVLIEKFEQEESAEDAVLVEAFCFQETEEKEEKSRPDMYTIFLFSVSFLVSLCYLVISFFFDNWRNTTGIIACVFVVASLIGILTAFVNIDIKSKK